jgi:hypothetical protein
MKAPALLVSGLVLTACGSATSAPPTTDPGPAERPTAVPAADGPVTTTHPVLVLDDGHPHACVDAVAASDPPQCGEGVPLAGWDWAGHEGTYETRGQVRYGAYVLTGTFDGTTLTVTGTADADSAPTIAPEPLPTTPCPEPAGGWVPPDPDRSGEHSLSQLQRLAQKRDDFALLWVDQSINPAWPAVSNGSLDDEDIGRMNDPRYEIINIQVTGDPAAATAEFRTVWGGSLCVSQVERTEKQVNAVLDGMSSIPGFQGGGGIGVGNNAHLTVTYDDGSYQRWLDATYGVGTVVVTSALTPVD